MNRKKVLQVTRAAKWRHFIHSSWWYRVCLTSELCSGIFGLAGAGCGNLSIKNGCCVRLKWRRVSFKRCWGNGHILGCQMSFNQVSFHSFHCQIYWNKLACLRAGLCVWLGYFDLDCTVRVHICPSSATQWHKCRASAVAAQWPHV